MGGAADGADPRREVQDELHAGAVRRGAGLLWQMDGREARGGEARGRAGGEDPQRWGELLRIMGAQQRVTIVAEQTNGRNIWVQRSSAPEEKLTTIQNALGIPAEPTCSLKFVWPQILPSPEESNSVSAT